LIILIGNHILHPNIFMKLYSGKNSKNLNIIGNKSVIDAGAWRL
jgi:hypothetical protein